MGSSKQNSKIISSNNQINQIQINNEINQNQLNNNINNNLNINNSINSINNQINNHSQILQNKKIKKTQINPKMQEDEEDLEISSSHEDNFFNEMEQEEINNNNNNRKINKFYKKEYNEDNNLPNANLNPNTSLTNKVWPKSRTFLSIVSKMFNDKYINEYQRGLLKEMIMDQNQDLDNILDEYEMDADSKKLYENIIALADSYSYDKKMML